MSEDSLSFKRSLKNYFDIILSILNFLIILFPLISKNYVLVISIFGILVSSTLVILTLYTFMKNNPLYTYYSFSLLFSGLLFLIPSIVINSLMIFLILPEIALIYTLSKMRGEISVKRQIAGVKVLGKRGFAGLIDERTAQNLARMNRELEIKKEKQRELFLQKYNGKKLLKNSLLFSLSMLTIFFLFIIFNLSN